MRTIITAIITSIIVTLLMVHFFKANRVEAVSNTQETAYERIMRTKTIRCGYNFEPPMLFKDDTTGKLKGATHDIIMKIGNLHGLKVDWAEQVGWSEMTAGLMANRYDIICNGKWIFAPQAVGGQFSPPIYYTIVQAYGRNDENRIAPDLSNLNNPEFTVTSMDGELNYYIARDRFPKAKRVEYPALSNPGELILGLITKKADVTFLPVFMAKDYMTKNPGKIKQLSANPVSVFDTAIMFQLGDYKLAGLLDASIRQLQGQHFIDDTLKKYGVDSEAVRSANLSKEQ